MAEPEGLKWQLGLLGSSFLPQIKIWLSVIPTHLSPKPRYITVLKILEESPHIFPKSCFSNLNIFSAFDNSWSDFQSGPHL